MESGAGRDPVHGRHHRLFGEQDAAVDIAHRPEPLLDVGGLDGLSFAQIDTRAERSLPGAGEDDGPDVALIVKPSESGGDGTGEVT